MSRDVRPIISTVLGLALLPGLLGLAGCSEQGTIKVPKAATEAKRDEIQKATQSGIPGKPTGGPSRQRR